MLLPLGVVPPVGRDPTHLVMEVTLKLILLREPEDEINSAQGLQ